MDAPESTCWTLIEHVAAGDAVARDEFGRRYLPIVRAYLCARWAGRLAPDEIEDAVQDVFVALLREEGALEHLRPRHEASFRPLLYGVVRNIALRIEHARARRLDPAGSSTFPADAEPAREESLSRAFDRAWAESILGEASELQEELARAGGADSMRRFELLRLLFHESLTIQEIAARWSVDGDALHKEAARAKREFKDALRQVVAFHHPEAPEDVERECRELLSLFG